MRNMANGELHRPAQSLSATDPKRPKYSAVSSPLCPHAPSNTRIIRLVCVENACSSTKKALRAHKFHLHSPIFSPPKHRELQPSPVLCTAPCGGIEARRQIIPPMSGKKKIKQKRRVCRERSRNSKQHPGLNYTTTRNTAPLACFPEVAEGEGFEPPEACASTVFKTAALNRSATPPSTATTQIYIKGGLRSSKYVPNTAFISDMQQHTKSRRQELYSHGQHMYSIRNSRQTRCNCRNCRKLFHRLFKMFTRQNRINFEYFLPPLPRKNCETAVTAALAQIPSGIPHPPQPPQAAMPKQLNPRIHVHRFSPWYRKHPGSCEFTTPTA